MLEKEILLQFYCTGIDGLPRDASFRLEAMMAEEVRATILTAALMLTFDAAEDSPVRAELQGVLAKIEAAGDQIKKNWLDRGSILRERLAVAEAWRDAPCSVVLAPIDRPKTVVWTGSLGALAATALPLLSAVQLRPSGEAGKWISGWPVPTVAPVKAEPAKAESTPEATAKAPEMPMEAAPAPEADGKLELTPADLNASIAAAKAKAEAAKVKAALTTPAPAPKKKELTMEEKINAAVKSGMDLAKARRLARAGNL